MPTRVTGLCPQCGCEAVGLVVLDSTAPQAKAEVWWCESGHVVVVNSDPEAASLKQLVYDFSEPTL